MRIYYIVRAVATSRVERVCVPTAYNAYALPADESIDCVRVCACVRVRRVCVNVFIMCMNAHTRSRRTLTPA